MERKLPAYLLTYSEDPLEVNKLCNTSASSHSSLWAGRNIFASIIYLGGEVHTKEGSQKLQQ